MWLRLQENIALRCVARPATRKCVIDASTTGPTIDILDKINYFS